jgi:uncharacterized protein
MVWLLVALFVYVLILFGIALISLHPYRIPIFMSPGALGCNQEAVEFQTSDGVTLRGWWVAVPAAKAVAILSHGYMMNRSELSPLCPLLASKGIASLVYDFRAHGQSGGKKSYLGYQEMHDVEAAVAYSRARMPGVKVVLIGSSMGAASSALAVGRNPGLADALVLDSAYSRLSSAVLGWWRFLGGNVLSVILAPTTIISIPLAGFNPWSVDVSKALQQAGSIPVLFIHGEKDNLALPSESQSNLKACQGPTSFVWMPGCGHSEGRWIHPEFYNQELIAFLEKHVL